MSSILKDVVAVVVLTFVALVVSSVAPHRPSTMTSVETKFADVSRGGYAIVPASCPSDPHTAGECDPVTGSYTATYTASYTATYTGSYTATYTNSYGPGTGSYTGSYTGGTTGSYTPSTGSYTPTETSYVNPTCWDGSTPAG